jgi:DNA (cytosine-5)-methyltransferase 1
VLSIFPGIDLLGRGFEEDGWCVVRGPDPLWGGDVRRFHPPAGLFAGVIGGSPCQDFSSLRRGDESGVGRELLGEFGRVVTEARPDWFLLENVPRVPTVIVPGYHVQRIDLRGTEVGLRQRRLRHFQFGSVTGCGLVVARGDTAVTTQRACTASEGRRAGRRGWAEFCELMGLPEPLELPGLSKEARYRAVGNGVPLPMGRMLAAAISAWTRGAVANCCACGCGRPVTGRRMMAGPACRKRQQRRRDTPDPVAPRGVTPAVASHRRDSAIVTGPSAVTPAESLFFISH